MTVTIQSIHFEADKKLLELIQKKCNKLDAYFDQIISGDVILKLNNASDHNNKDLEIKLQIPGTVLFAKMTCQTFEEAIDLASDSLSKQLKKHKEKLKTPSYKPLQTK